MLPACCVVLCVCVCELMVMRMMMIVVMVGVGLTLTVLSHPHDASLITGGPDCLLDTSAPAGTAGDHDTAVQPMACCPGSLEVVHVPSGWCVRMEMVPSEEPHASISPSSYGAQHTLLTEEVCRVEGESYTCEWGGMHAWRQRTSRCCAHRAGLRAPSGQRLTCIQIPSCPSFHTMTL